MRLGHFKLVVVSVLWCAIAPGQTSAPASGKDDLKNAAQLAHRYEAARVEAQIAQWEVQDTVPTVDPADAAKWKVNRGEVVLSKEGMRINSKADVYTLATFKDKAWTLPVGVTYEVMMPGAPCHDGSMVLIPAGLPPTNFNNGMALVVGGYQNTENYMEFFGQTRRDIGGPLLRVGKWTKVTLLAGTNNVSAVLNGELVASEPLPARAARQQMQLSLYTMSDTAIFRNVQVLRPKKDAAATMPAGFREEELKGAVATAGKFLADGRFTTRQEASEVLFELRPASNELVLELIKSDDMEVSGRARLLAERMGLVKMPRGNGRQNTQWRNEGDLAPGGPFGG